MTDSEAIELHNRVLRLIYVQEYYCHIAERLKALPSFKNIETTKSTAKIWLFWNEFWERLPDAEYIRTPIFFQICDLAEGSYLTLEEKK